MENNNNIREENIAMIAEKIYAKFGHLYTEDSVEFQRQAINKYYGSNMSYDDIVSEMIKDVDVKIDERNRSLREEGIEKLAGDYFDQYEDIINDSLDNYKKEAISKYLDSKLTLEEIRDAMLEELQKKKEELKEKAQKEVDKVDDKTEAEEKVEATPLEEEEKKEEEPIEEYETTESKEEDKQDAVVDAVTNVAAVGVVGAAGVAAVAESQSDIKDKMAGLAGPMGGAYSGGKDYNQLEQWQNSSTQFQEAIAEATGNPVPASVEMDSMLTEHVDSYKARNSAQNELNAMLGDSSYKAVEVNANTNIKGDAPKQLVKTNNNPNPNGSSNGAASAPGQAGNISLFSIGLSLLIIIGAVLLAMILNIVLK